MQFVSGDITTFVYSLKEQPGKDIWLIGGGQINTVMLNAGLIDEMILTAFPLVLGEGIPLFAPGVTCHPFKTVSCQTYYPSLLQWHLVKAVRMQAPTAHVLGPERLPGEWGNR